MIFLQVTGQDVEFLNILLDICPPLGILALIGGVVYFVVRFMRRGD